LASEREIDGWAPSGEVQLSIRFSLAGAALQVRIWFDGVNPGLRASKCDGTLRASVSEMLVKEKVIVGRAKDGEVADEQLSPSSAGCSTNR
jgi:hypothetical protein